MSDSNHSDGHENGPRHRRDRLEGIKRWAEYVRDKPPEVWGPQQNALVNAQLESARAADLTVEHLQTVREFGGAAAGTTGDGRESDSNAEDES